ncbi:TetR family transcriptional regulator, partial [Acinetobacter baumannii]
MISMTGLVIPREGKAAKSRARIISAAAGLFAERGFEGTSIRDI